LKRIDSVIIRELVGPWCFGVAMFTVVLFAGTFLLQFSNFLVMGVSAMRVLELSALLMPSIIIKTFPMAILLAGLLGFGRLSSDSEIVAMRAAGVSILRLMYPVTMFALGIAFVSFLLNELVVPPATLRGIALQNQIAREVKTAGDQQMAASQTDESGNRILIVASDFSLAARQMTQVTITAYNKAGTPSFFLYAPLLRYTDQSDWEIIGGARLLSYDGAFLADLDGRVWPDQVPHLSLSPQDLLSQRLKAMDAFGMVEMRRHIEEVRDDPQVTKKQIANLEYGFWNKVALPLAALVYALLGAPLGIRTVRTGAATGFAVSVAIIFAYITLANLMNVYAMGGAIPPYVASFTPLVVGLIAAGVIIWRRNG
jgi:lipopolysaccharide export system permease protein